MSMVLSLIKTHLLSLISGVVAIACIVLAAMGMSSDAVSEAMKKRLAETGATNIASLRSSAKNTDIINAEKERGRRFQEEFEKTVQAALEINERKPLMEGVFPTPVRLSTPFEFREAYKTALSRLPQIMQAGTLPNLAEIQEEQQNVEDLIAQKQEEIQETLLADEGAAAGAPAAGRTPAVQPGRAPTGTFVTGQNPAANVNLQALIQNDPKFNPLLRARVAKAKDIRCYYDETSFHTHPLVAALDAPLPRDMWAAQVSLWVQQDVVQAIANCNQEAAARLRDADVYVEHVPVKHLVSVHVHGYILDKKIWPFPSGVSRQMDIPQSFTGRKSDDQFHVIRFTVQVVVDQREINNLVNWISKENFYTCLNQQYQPVPPEFPNNGYLYGTAPVVLATLDFEGYLARRVYEQWMPKEVLDALSGQGGE